MKTFITILFGITSFGLLLLSAWGIHMVSIAYTFAGLFATVCIIFSAIVHTAYFIKTLLTL